MPAKPVDPRSIRAFRDAKAFETWLAAHHDRANELHIRIYKKDSGVDTVTHAQAVEVALCWGWIDGIRLSYDAKSFLQRFSPRRPKSVWSKINRDTVTRLLEEGRMTPHGLAHVEAAKADGRWKRAYAGSKSMRFPRDLKAAISAEPKAMKTFTGLNKQNRFALAFRTLNTKTKAGRQKKIADLVALLKQGKAPYPNR
jgi:uncharacterized protein YdeI (YjbR/CyaY-like superfamily)